jgi:hypothetical protein
MMDKVSLVIDLTPEERQRIEDLARQRGYEAPADYLKALVESDAEEDEGFDEDPVAAFRQSWHEAMTGQTHPVSTLWDDLDDE